VEDLVLAGWVVIVGPVLFRASGDKGPFDPDQPLQGLLRLGAVLCVVACLAARRAPVPQGKDEPSMINRGSVGPFVGGLLLITISGFTALDIGSEFVLPALVLAAAVAIVVHFVVPPLPVLARRALVTPFVAVAAGIYWNVIAQLTGGHGFTVTPSQVISDPHTAELILGVLIAFSAVYYAMLIYAPRQIATRDGGFFEWGIRYALFVVSVFLGVGWLGAIST
jgi:hypothetical protein